MQDGGTFPATALNPVDFGIANGVTRPIGLPQIIVAGARQLRRPGQLSGGTRRHALRVQRHGHVDCGPPRDEGRRRVPPLSQQQFRGRHRPVQLPQRGRVPVRHRQRLQHHRRGAPQPHHPGRALVLRAGRHHPRTVAHHRSRAALRMAHDADRARQPVRGVRCGHRVARAGRRRRREDLSREQPQLPAAARPGVDAHRRWQDRAACRVRHGGRSTGHDHRQWHRRQPALRDAADGHRRHSSGRRGEPHAADRPGAVDRRSQLPQCLTAIVERQRAARAGGQSRRHPRLLWRARTRPAHRAQHQPAGEWRPPISRALRVEPDPSRRHAWHDHANGEHRDSRVTTRSRSSSPNACRADCNSTRRIPGPSRWTPIR